MLSDLRIFLIPAMMLICGVLTMVHPAKERNSFTGFRTRRSMLSEETRKFANRWCGRLWTVLGAVMLEVFGLLKERVPELGEGGSAVGPAIAVQLVVLIASAAAVQILLGVFFDREGKRKNTGKN